MTDSQQPVPRFGGFGESRDGSLINRTEAALLLRGVDSAKAAELRASGWTLAKLQQESNDVLKGLGLEFHVVEALRSGSRPNIPLENLMQVLVAERFTCCVCRDPSLAIIVHHLHEWHETNDHSPANLALLCVHHHERAHSQNKLSRNLDTETIGKFKLSWEAEVQKLDTRTVLEASRIQDDAWLYFNHLRLFELAQGRAIKCSELDHYAPARAAGLIEVNGSLRERDRSWSYMYDSGNGNLLYLYMRDVLHELLSGLTVLNISDMLDKGVLNAVLGRGDFVVLQGAFNFSSNEQRSGRGQITVGRRSANHIEIEFTFDRWEATSSSAWARWLNGRRDVAALVRLVTVVPDNDILKLEGTVIAISQALNGLKTREYAAYPYRQGVWITEEDGEDDGETI